MAKKNKRGAGKAAALPPELLNEVASTGDGRDITRPYVLELQQPRDPKLWSVVDWGVYERIRKDDQVKSCMEQRIRAVVSRDWDVLPGDENNPRSVEAAEAMTDTLERIGWDLVTEKMLWASFYGLSVGELNWGSLDGLGSGRLMDYVYYSFTVYTTLGFGDIVPRGMIRYLSGIESLTGLVLITWTASFLYLEMRKYWDDEGQP